MAVPSKKASLFVYCDCDDVGLTGLCVTNGKIALRHRADDDFAVGDCPDPRNVVSGIDRFN